LRNGGALEVEQLLEPNAVADAAVGKLALVDNAADAPDLGARAAGKISGHAEGHGERCADC